MNSHQISAVSHHMDLTHRYPIKEVGRQNFDHLDPVESELRKKLPPSAGLNNLDRHSKSTRIKISETTLYPMTQQNNDISIGDFSPCAIILNNISYNRLKILENFKQDLISVMTQDKSNSLKSDHLQVYQQEAKIA